MKNAQYDLRKAFYYVIVVIIIAIIFFVTVGVYHRYQAKVVEKVKNLENEMIVFELITSPHCLAYYDSEIRRTYPSIIDMNKFDEKIFKENCMKYIKKPFEVKIGEKTLKFGKLTDGTTIVKYFFVKEGEETKLRKVVFRIENEK